jgi:hypothetical protein
MFCNRTFANPISDALQQAYASPPSKAFIMNFWANKTFSYWRREYFLYIGTSGMSEWEVRK